MENLYFCNNCEIKNKIQNTKHLYIFPALCNSLHRKNSKCTTWDIDYKRDISFCMRVWKEIIKKKAMREKVVKEREELTDFRWDVAVYLLLLKNGTQYFLENMSCNSEFAFPNVMNYFIFKNFPAR